MLMISQGNLQKKKKSKIYVTKQTDHVIKLSTQLPHYFSVKSWSISSKIFKYIKCIHPMSQ